MIDRLQMEVAGRNLILETGRMAKLADGAVFVQYGDTVVLVTAVSSEELIEPQEFFPLTVEYREMTYAAGKIPGGFFKREGRPRDHEILTARLIDRPLRPFFPPEYNREVQVIATVLSSDQQNDPDILAINGASVALTISDIPFREFIGAVRVGRMEDKFLINPTLSQLERSELDLVVAGTRNAIVMVEGGAKEVTESMIMEAFEVAHQQIKEIVDFQEQFTRIHGKSKQEYVPFVINEKIEEAVRDYASSRVDSIIVIADKQERNKTMENLLQEILSLLAEQFPGEEVQIRLALRELERERVRRMIIDKKVRVDGRVWDELRPIKCEIGVLPRTHGSALFTRGQTQSLVVTTLGTSVDEQIVDELERETKKSFMVHYNFPPFSVGEVRPVRGPGRREIGHGALTERALTAVMPPSEKFPYTVRVVSDILESNGSSSMASVCGGSLSLMDAGVPIKAPVAGVAIGLVKEDNQVAILTDIIGLEDHFGDMDFKIAGTSQGITALQLDIKIDGVNFPALQEALHQAREARLKILTKMIEAIEKPRPSISTYAPRIITLQINPDRIRDVIGPGGKIIRKIIEETGVTIDIEDDGKVMIASPDQEAASRAVDTIRTLTQEAEIGKIYLGKVTRLTNFGVFVEILSGQEGLVHISQLDEHRVSRVENVVREGDEILVKVMEIDKGGRINLSRRAALRETGKGASEKEKRQPRVNIRFRR